MTPSSPAPVVPRLQVRWPGPPPTLAVAQQYCRRLAGRHYENFSVVTWLAPRRLRQHLASVYAYCRWADDLADESAGPEESLVLLDHWESQLDDCYAGKSAHPVFVALADTIRTFDLPRRPFAELLVAFRRDQHQTRYETFDDLLDYCRHSANPVGRLVLALGRETSPANVALSDSICTGLQLVNFWQDVRRDLQRGRVYLPRESLRRFGCQESMLAEGHTPQGLKSVLAFEVERAESYLKAGQPLVHTAPRELRLSIDLFVRGGLKVAQRIGGIGCDVLAQRPTIKRREKLLLAALAWWHTRGPLAQGGAS